MKKKIAWILLILTTVAVTSCASSRKQYLQFGVGTLTQEDVSRRWGPPKEVRRLDNGCIVWKYRFSEVGELSYCTEYILTFNENRVLMGTNAERCVR